VQVSNSNEELNLEVLKALLQKTREKLVNVTLANVELETALDLERFRVSELENQLKNKTSNTK
jgi:hypothetical protein